jgi:hypothetical protein
MYDRKQAQLLEQFLATLRHDPQAAPPPDLDPVVAELARKFKQESVKQQQLTQQKINRPSADMKARVWQKAMLEHRTQLVVPVAARHVQRRSSSPFTLAAAVSALTVFLVVMLVIAVQPRQQEEYATALTEEVVSEDVAMTATPLDVNRTMTINYIPAQLGRTIEGTLSTTSPMAIYEYDITENVVVVARAEGEGFRPRLYHTVGGNVLDTTARITIVSSPDENGDVIAMQPTMIPPVAPFSVGTGVFYVSDIPNPMWFVATAGETIQVVVSSLDNVTQEPFKLTTTVIEPVILQSGDEQTFAFSKEQPFAYFNFEGEADQSFTLSVSGEPTKNLILFDTANPRSTMNTLPRTAFKLESLGFSLDTQGVKGILIEPENPDTTGTINVSLMQET